MKNIHGSVARVELAQNRFELTKTEQIGHARVHEANGARGVVGVIFAVTEH